MKTLLALFLLTGSAAADVSGIEITSRSSFADGREFGEVGEYEMLRGKIRFVFDPANEWNGAVVDLDLAPTNDDGHVEARADLVVLRPVDPDKGSGTGLLEVSNRGGQASISYFNRGRGVVGGDGFLMEQGLTVIWVGWQHDVPRGLSIDVPIAKTTDGPIFGLVRSDWTVDAPVATLALGHRNHSPYLPVDPSGSENVLTRRSGRLAKSETVDRERWRFSDDGTRIEMDGGFEAPAIYELVYRSMDPKVVGLGLAAIRDTMSFAKYDEDCPFAIERGLALGISQTGRFLRHFLYQGFNTDEEGRQVFDGMLIHTAGAGRGSFNHRFAQASRDAHRYSAFFYPTDLFPFSGRTQRDSLTERQEGILDIPRERGHVPKLFYTNTGYEYWGRAASLLHTSIDGASDVALLPEERIYHLSSAQHFVVPFPPRAGSRMGETDVYRGSSVDFLYSERALLAALQAWVEEDESPPASAYPRIADGTLVPLDELELPTIAGLRQPQVIHEAYRAYYGDEWGRGIISRQPPLLGPAFPALVSQVDSFGNEIAGLRSVETLVPLGSFFPWHLRRDGELSDFYGSYAPLPLDDEQAERSGDSRPSVRSLYLDKNDYLSKVRAAAAQLVADRYLLARDVDRVVDRAAQHWHWIHRDR